MPLLITVLPLINYTYTTLSLVLKQTHVEITSSSLQDSISKTMFSYKGCVWFYRMFVCATVFWVMSLSLHDMINLNETDCKTRQLNTYLRIKTFIVKTLYKCPDSVLRRAVPQPYAQHQECNTICKSTMETYHISVQFKKVVHYSLTC